MRRFAGIVLAAGRSRRFGDEPKLLQPLGGRSVAAHAVVAAKEAGLSPLIVVCPRADNELQEAVLERAPDAILALVENDALSDSLRAGLDAVGDVEGAFILLADMPFVDSVLINLIAAAWDEAALAVAPTHDGKRGNPVLLSARAFALSQNLTGDQGLGGLLWTRAEEVRLVQAGPECLLDIDTRADLESARVRWGA